MFKKPFECFAIEKQIRFAPVVIRSADGIVQIQYSVQQMCSLVVARFQQDHGKCSKERPATDLW